MPSQPCSAKARWKSSGKPPSRSRASQNSSGKRAQIFSIAARIACCSVEKEKSMAHLAPADHENVAVSLWFTARACGILEKNREGRQKRRQSRAAVAWQAGKPLAIETIEIEGPKA